MSGDVDQIGFFRFRYLNNQISRIPGSNNGFNYYLLRSMGFYHLYQDLFRSCL